MSRASKIIRDIETREKQRRKKKAPTVEEVYDADDTTRFTVKADALWWLLSRHLINRSQYFAGRELQGIYLTSQVQPPRCVLGGGIRSYGVAGKQFSEGYPADATLSCMMALARIRRRIRPKSWNLLETMLCRYWADDDVMRGRAQRAIEKNADQISLALVDLAWAVGFSTETIYAYEKCLSNQQEAPPKIESFGRSIRDKRTKPIRKIIRASLEVAA